MKYFILLLYLFVGCSPESELVTNNSNGLVEKLKVIEEWSAMASCNDPLEWRFTAIGSKPCGGPHGYIAYSTKIDTSVFLALVQEYTALEKMHNIETGAISDCAIENPPVSITCEMNKPILIY